MARADTLRRLTSRLISRRNALRRTLSHDLVRLRQLRGGTGVGDEADAAVDSANEELSSQLAEIESRELGQIEHALYRIAAGVFGRCEFCGGRISATRLDALPYATSCIDCQRENERHAQPKPLDLDSNRWAKVMDASNDQGGNAEPIDFGNLEMLLAGSGSQN